MGSISRCQSQQNGRTLLLKSYSLNHNTIRRKRRDCCSFCLTEGIKFVEMCPFLENSDCGIIELLFMVFCFIYLLHFVRFKILLKNIVFKSCKSTFLLAQFEIVIMLCITERRFELAKLVLISLFDFPRRATYLHLTWARQMFMTNMISCQQNSPASFKYTLFTTS